MKRIVFTQHASEMIVLRQLNKKFVEECIRNPDEIMPAKENKHSYVKNMGKNYLKVIIAEEKQTFIVITTYWFAKVR